MHTAAAVLQCSLARSLSHHLELFAFSRVTDRARRDCHLCKRGELQYRHKRELQWLLHFDKIPALSHDKHTEKKFSCGQTLYLEICSSMRATRSAFRPASGRPCSLRYSFSTGTVSLARRPVSAACCQLTLLPAPAAPLGPARSRFREAAPPFDLATAAEAADGGASPNLACSFSTSSWEWGAHSERAAELLSHRAAP